MNVQSLFRLPPTTGDVGIEIEMEGKSLPSGEAVSKYWTKEADGSLRGESAEYVLQKPVEVKNITKALNELEKAFNSHGTTFYKSHRAGIHVHVNVQDLTPNQLVSFITAYCVLEEVFLSYCEESRRGNHFCLRLSDASWLMDEIAKAIEEGDLSRFRNDDLRYASINLTALHKYGSVEFRALESTDDFDKITIWAKALHQLKVWASGVSDPTEVIAQSSLLGFLPFAKNMLGDYWQVFAPLATEEKIIRGVRNIQYAVYSRKWGGVNHNIFSKNSGVFQ